MIAMKMLLFSDATMAAKLQERGIPVMRQRTMAGIQYTVADTSEIRKAMQLDNEHFDWSKIASTSHLCF